MDYGQLNTRMQMGLQSREALKFLNTTNRALIFRLNNCPILFNCPSSILTTKQNMKEKI